MTAPLPAQAATLQPLSEQKASEHLDEFLQALGSAAANGSASLDDEAARQFLACVLDLSPFLRDCAFKEPEFVASFFKAGPDDLQRSILDTVSGRGTAASDEAGLMTDLRIAKRKFALLCGLADLAGHWNGQKVTAAFSEFASACLKVAFDFLLLEQHHLGKLVLVNESDPQQNCGLVVLGMGKLGAGELNYSSDIDLIVFFDPDAAMQPNTDDPVTLYGRMIRKLIKIMQERTGDGYVFRTDLRLRPDPSSTPLAIPVPAALNYYEGQGQNWERAAMIKARAVAGDLGAADAFLAELQPFIWRKYLDYAAINDVHSIKRQIHAHKGFGEIAVPGHNVKLGRGGIREIEFFAQTQQLIAGGRNPDLRHRKTIRALEKLARNGWIDDNEFAELSDAYWFLRNLEHRIQMVSDEQTHLLPDTKQELKRIALMHGEADVEKFSRQVKTVLEKVQGHYSRLFESASDLSAVEGNLVFTGDEHDPETLDTLRNMGFTRAEEVMKIVKGWHTARLPALQATQARELLTELVPTLLVSFSRTGNPDEVMFNFDRFVAGLPVGIQLFAILKSNTALADLLVSILGAAPSLAEAIARKPHVFDAMLEPQFAGTEPQFSELKEYLDHALERAEAYEVKLDQARRFYAENRFLLGCMHFSGQISAQQVSRAFTVLAEVMLVKMLEVVREEFEIKHGKVPSATICILAMGRLGSRELTATSDLDLIFLYDFDQAVEQSDGLKPLAPSQYFIRLIQRFIAAMSSPTAEGIIFELDFRLRPSGNAGPLATHVESFLKYQREDAWVWEAQALTRARAVAGDAQLCERVMSEIPKAMREAVSDKDLAKEVRDMRMRIEKEKGSTNPWDTKLVAGGLIDIEFIAQWLVLASGRTDKQSGSTRNVILDENIDLLSKSDRAELAAAFDLYVDIMQLQRICLGSGTDIDAAPPGFATALCSRLDLPDIGSVTAHLVTTQQATRKIFDRLLGEANPS